MRPLLEMIGYEFSLDLREKTQYKTSLISDFLIFTSMYIVIYYMGISREFGSYYIIDEKTSRFLVLVGYFYWQLNSTALGYISSTIKREATRGTLEIVIQSHYSLILIYFIKMVVNLLFSILSFGGIVIFFVMTNNMDVRDILFLIIMLVISFPSIIGMYGIGLMIGGISLKEKNVGQFVLIIQTLLLFVSNALSPTRGFITVVLPFTEGISIVRQLYMGNSVHFLNFLIYFGVNCGWIILGIVVFSCFLKRERKTGSFDNY